MQPIGRVKTVSPKGQLIVVSAGKPRMGTHVVDDKSRHLGRVIRLFGPVSRPYVTILPDRERGKDLLGLIGKQLFVDADYKPRQSRDRDGGYRGPPRKGGYNDRRSGAPQNRRPQHHNKGGKYGKKEGTRRYR